METNNGNVWAPSHTKQIFNPQNFRALVASTAKGVRTLKKELKADAIAACGNSGLVLAGAVAYRLNMPLLAVRKKGDSAHDSALVNGFCPTKSLRYIILDDLISSGDTVAWMFHNIKKEANSRRSYGQLTPTPELVGIALYETCNWPIENHAVHEYGKGYEPSTIVCRTRVFNLAKQDGWNFNDPSFTSIP